jgi:hypothetical protein
MEGSVLSFLKAEWKVSDTGSAHLASSLQLIVLHLQFLSKSTNQKQELLMAAMFVNGSGQN